MLLNGIDVVGCWLLCLALAGFVWRCTLCFGYCWCVLSWAFAGVGCCCWRLLLLLLTVYSY